MEKKKIFEIAKYIGFFCAFFLFAKAGILGVVYPFAFGFLYALIWCNQRVYVVCPLYILACLLANLNLASLIISSTTALVILIMYLIHLKLKKAIKPYLLVFYALISQSAFVYLNVVNNTPLVIIVSTLVVGLLFLIACLNFFSAIFTRGLTSRLKVFEIISGCFIIMAISCGLNSFSFLDFEIVKLVGVLSILVLSYTSSFGLLYGSVFALGTVLNGANAVYVAPLIMFSIATLPFKQSKKIFMALSVFAVELVVGFGLKLYYSYELLSALSVFVGCLIFVLLPNKFLQELSICFTTSKNIAMRNIVNRNRESLKKRFISLSEVFSEMDGVFRAMIKGGLTKQQATTLVMSEIKDKLCQNCSERSKCHRVYEREINTVFSELVLIALEKESLTLLDIPAFLTTKCFKVNALVALINENAKQLKQYASLINSVDSGKILVAEQLAGISQIMKNLSLEVGQNIVFNSEKENKIVEALSYNNIICGEALIYHQKPNILNVTLAIKNDSNKRAKIAKIVSKILNLPMAICHENKTERPGYTILTLKNSPKFDIVFGTAGTPKQNNKVSGDCYSLIRLEDDKFIMAICDGMGNGERAEDVSSLTLGLIENFYKAGFDNELILSVVNNLLSIKNQDDMFSALDLCIVDLKNGIADFIKLGASVGFVKHITHTSTIKCESMPIGIVKELKPIINKIVLNVGDVVIICSDGVCDSFPSEEVFCEYINNIEEVNPQEIANDILETAKKYSENQIKDDMTVVVGRLYQNWFFLKKWLTNTSCLWYDCNALY